MGFLLSKMINSYFAKQKTRILLVGLDGAGKTTFLYKLKLNELVQTAPTIGFNLEYLNYKNLHMTIWDVGGQQRIRRLWTNYFANTDAIIFMLDSADEERIEIARDELHNMLESEELPRAHLLVFANKQDIGKMTPSEIESKLELNKLKMPWKIQGCSALSGDGLYDGMDWLSKGLPSRK
eukprot:TRINITY_DN23030_c0_g1_i1.p1 TRINITY_DN23030_c0_g1~~TRINITY_DN23030_c0_g1_i1.p1  ORF type:complete len:180 (+),score=32.26 TRINITY_DN23030_c0_g1_i1:18-557(+)